MPHLIRRLHHINLAALRAHLVRLDPQSRQARFGLALSDVSLLDHADACLRPGSIAFGFFENGVIRGAAELALYKCESLPSRRDAEAAFSVERPWRRNGVGTRLMSRVILAARNRRIVTLTIFCQRRNQAMLALARKFEADLKFEVSDVTGHLIAKPPGVFSFGCEVVDDMLDFGLVARECEERLRTRLFRGLMSIASEPHAAASVVNVMNTTAPCCPIVDKPPRRKLQR